MNDLHHHNAFNMILSLIQNESQKKGKGGPQKSNTVWGEKWLKKRRSLVQIGHQKKLEKYDSKDHDFPIPYKFLDFIPLRGVTTLFNELPPKLGSIAE